MSIYEKIIHNLTQEGTLPNDFSIEESVEPNQLRYAPGLLDSIFSPDTKGARKVLKKISRLLYKYFKTNDESYIKQIETHMGEVRSISLVDPILQNICEKHSKINADSLVAASKHLVKTSDNSEIVKIGIALLGLVDLGHDSEAIELIKTLSVYDDFTLYCVVAASGWTSGNSIVFHVAQNVHGWGKIHAVERLEPETSEIRNWILRKGCENGIMDEYLGLECARKGNLISALRQESIDADLFNGVSIILNALLDEGPVDGISAYEHAEEAIELFLEHASRHTFDVSHLWQMLNLSDYLKNSDMEQKDELLVKCDNIIDRPDWKEKIIQVIKNQSQFDAFYAANVAKRLDIEITNELFELIKSDLVNNYSYFPQVCKDEGMAQEIITLCEKVLPLSEMTDGMGDYFFAGKLISEHLCLDTILPELVAYPNQGEKLIMTGLNSRVVRSRNMACRALSGWVKELDKPLAEIAPNFYDELERLYPLEVNEYTKKDMKTLLDGLYIKDEPYVEYND